MARLLRAADDDWNRARPSVRGCKATLDRWGSLLLRDAEAHVRLREHELRINVTAGDAPCKRMLDAADQQHGQELLVRLGRRRAIVGHFVHCFGSATQLGPGPSTTGFQVFDWTIRDEVRRATTFVGTVSGFHEVCGWANVRLRSVFGVAHLYVPRFGPELPDVALIVRRSDRTEMRLALHHEDALRLDRKWLGRVVRAVSFTLGVPTHVAFFAGADVQGRRVGARGSLFGVARPFRSLPGQPIPASGGAWAAPFLRRLLALLHARPDVPELDLALEYYLDSYDDPADAAYLKLVVVLEGLALRVLREEGSAIGIAHRAGTRDRLSLARDQSAWRAFSKKLAASSESRAWRAHVEGRRGEIAQLLLPQRVGGKNWVDGLIDRWAPIDFTNGDELAAGQRVLAALLALGVRPDDHMKREFREWHVARHTGIAPGQRGALEARLAVLRSTLVLIVARWAGYTGPTLGHVRNVSAAGRPGGIDALPSAISGVDVDPQLVEATVRYVDRPD